MSAFVHIAARFLNAGRGRCERCSLVTDLLSGRTVTGRERDMCAGCWAPDSCRVVDYPSEMGPFYCEFCAANDADDHEDGCERFCRTHRAEVDEDGCWQCRRDDAADDAGIGRRSPLMRWSPGTVRR